MLCVKRTSKSSADSCARVTSTTHCDDAQSAPHRRAHRHQVTGVGDDGKGHSTRRRFARRAGAEKEGWQVRRATTASGETHLAPLASDHGCIDVLLNASMSSAVSLRVVRSDAADALAAERTRLESRASCK